MGNLQQAFSSGAGLFWLVLLLVAVGMAVWAFVLQRRQRRLEIRIDDLFGSANSDNVVRMLAEYLGTVRVTAQAVNQMKAEHDQIAHVIPSVIRHVGLVRFSPFHDTGGDQSFALALLDGQGDGVVLTALHSRSDSRLYAKPLERGNSAYTLTPEEKEAMTRAVEGKAVLR